jgi:hypothetical protein
MNARRILLTLAIAGLAPSLARAAAGAAITRVEPTPLFPRQTEGSVLRQRVRLHLENAGPPVAMKVRITVGLLSPEMQELGTVAEGKSVANISLPDIAAPATLKIELLVANGEALATTRENWLPQKKWKIYCVSYSHQDLGFGDYPQRLRTSIRHENIRLPLQFCRETDHWHHDSQYRFNIETSEPITSFISFHGKDAARELAWRIREGRIELGGLHNTSNTEELGHELIARLFYMSGRHAVDLLGAPPGKTIQNDDVIGLTWPLATYAAEAGYVNFFHGFNGCGHCELPAESEPVFYWQAPDGKGRLLERATAYGGYGGDGPGDGSEAYILQCIDRLGGKLPGDVLLLQEGTDFQLATRTFANRIHDWNAQWAYPRMVCSTMDMYFEAIAKSTRSDQIKSFAADSNNQWSDQDYAAARATAQARRLSETIPATETLATVAQVLAGGNDQWINLFQGYHRLLQYFEHTNAKDTPYGNMTWYETELEENREMVAEASFYQQEAFRIVSRRLVDVVTRTGERNLMVFNPLPYCRTDVVRAELPQNMAPLDPDTGKLLPVQRLAEGVALFVAPNVPATGYRVFSLQPAPTNGMERADPTVDTLEGRFYRLRFRRATGSVTSLFDKMRGVELIEQKAPHGFNEYLYEFRKQTAGTDFDSVWSRMEKADAVTVDRGPVADVLTVVGRAGGARAICQTVVLYHDLRRIDFGIRLDKAAFRGVRDFPSKHEAVFVALPLAVPEFTIHHELPGCVVEPYRQQFQGSATDHYAIRGFTDLSNDKYGVTVSPIEGSLVCYGEPTSSPVLGGHEDHFKRDRTYPTKSRLYLYLLNNMFDVNIAADQQGPVSFRWALCSHEGGWQAGGADRFGRSVLQPLLAWHADGKNTGLLPGSASFMNIDAANVSCSVVKPAEANGRGFILRLHETGGQATTATVSLPLLPRLESAVATSLVEDDRAEKYEVTGASLQITLPKFGVKTVRVTCAANPIAVADLSAKAAADMQVDLNWRCKGTGVSHFNIYRDTLRECAPTKLNFIDQSATGRFSDRPQVHAGGWLRSCLRPQTTYYYRVVPVDRANNLGTSSTVVSVTTPASEQANLPPVAVEGLRAILVSPITKDNFVNLLFRTACEPDVVGYEIHRGTQPKFTAGKESLIGFVKSDDIPPRSGGYGEQKKLHKVKEYDHATFSDKSVGIGTSYCYKVRAVDSAGQKGPFSVEASVRTKEVRFNATAQSVYSPEFPADNAVDGGSDPYGAWISKPFGGGTKDKPLDIWWAVELLPRPVTIQGVRIIGDHRTVIPLQKSLQVQVRQAGAWKTIGNIKGATAKDITVPFAQSVTTDALRVFVQAADLPRSERADVDGIVRICGLRLLAPDGGELLLPMDYR